MITIVDYGLGNIHAIANVFNRLNIPVQSASNSDQLSKAQRIILPGVGAFDFAMERLEASGMRRELDAAVLSERKPVLGICVGMQMLCNRSEEGTRRGLGWIDADILRLQTSTPAGPLQLPHMGWNDAKATRSSALFSGLEDEARFYFLHSYFCSPKDTDHTLSTTDYGRIFTSSVARDNIFGVQFHPEKSHKWGVRLLSNFARI